MLLDGKAPLPGQIIKLPELAKTFRTLAEHGKNGFYTGRIAEAIVELVKSKGGVMELDDLAKHETSIVEPIKYTYGGEITLYEVYCNGLLHFEIISLFIRSAHPMVKASISWRFHFGTSIDIEGYRDHRSPCPWHTGKYARTRQSTAAIRNGAQLC